jgi:hypothetical protein
LPLKYASKPTLSGIESDHPSGLGGAAEHRALHPEQPPTTEQHHRLAVHLANLYTHTVSPAAASRAHDVLDNAYRQAVRDHGTRTQDLAENGSSRDDLTAQFTAIRADLADLWRRAQAVAHRIRARRVNPGRI